MRVGALGFVRRRVTLVVLRFMEQARTMIRRLEHSQTSFVEWTRRLSSPGHQAPYGAARNRCDETGGFSREFIVELRMVREAEIGTQRAWTFVGLSKCGTVFGLIQCFCRRVAGRRSLREQDGFERVVEGSFWAGQNLQESVNPKPRSGYLWWFRPVQKSKPCRTWGH